MARLRKAVVGQSEPDWATVLPQLDDYIEAQLNGSDYAALYPDMALLLDQSVSLAEAYARLYAEREADYSTVDAEVPSADLSFLQAPLGERIQRAIERGGNAIRLRLDAGLLPLLAPPTSLEPVFRAPDASRYADHVLHLDAEVFTLDAWTDSAETSRCLLEVTVEPPGKSWPDLADSTVTVTVAGQIHSEKTDAFGLASFANLPVNDLATLELAIELNA